MKFVGGYSHKQQLRDEYAFRAGLAKYSELLLNVDKESLEQCRHQIRCLETGTALFKRCADCKRLYIEFKKAMSRLPVHLRNSWTCYSCRVKSTHDRRLTKLPEDYQSWVDRSAQRQPLYEKVYEAWYAAINKGVTEETISIEELKSFKRQQ